MTATGATAEERMAMEVDRIGASSEWESLWERIGASVCKIQREQEAKLDKILKSLQDLCSTMEARDASSGGCKSHLEFPKFSGNLDFHKSIDVDRAIVDEDLMEQPSSGRYEEMDTELEIGVEDGARVSMEIEDIQFLEVTVTPLQKTEEMEIFMPLPHNGKSTEVKKRRELEQEKLKGTERLPPARENAQPKELVVSLPTPIYCNSASKWLLECDHKPKVKMKCRVDRVEFYSKFRHHCNSVSLGLLWRCASKLEASISLVTSIFSQDYFSEIVDTGSSRHGMDSIGGVVEQLSGVVKQESMMFGKDAIGNFEEFGKYSNFSLQFCFDAKAGGGKIDHGQVKKGMALEQNQLQRIERLSHARLNAPVRELTVVLSISAGYSLSLSWLLNWFPRPKVKMKTKEVELGDLISTLTQELGEGTHFVDDASRFLSDKITRAVVKVPAYLNDSQRTSSEDVSSLSYGFERKNFTPKDVQVPEQDGKDNRDIFILEIGILVGKKHGGKREEDPLHGDMSFDRCFCIDEGIEQLEQLGSLCNHYVCQGRFYIDEGLERVEKLETLIVKVDHLSCYDFQPKPLWILVRIRFWTKTGPWLQSFLITFHLGCLYFALFLPTMTRFLPSLRTRKLNGGSIDTITIAWLMKGDEAYEVCWQSLAKEVETGESTLRLTHNCLLIIAFDVLMRVLRWIRERSVNCLLEASIRDNGHIRSETEAAGEGERVWCLKRLSVVQSHYLGSGCSLAP